MAKETFLAKVQARKKIILNETVLAIDPSSGSSTSAQGWAIFTKGLLVASGTVPVDKGAPIYTRLVQLHLWLEKFCRETNPQLLLIEQIRGRAHTFLRWACGVTIAACNVDTVEVPVASWKKEVKSGYVKGDENDAIAIGEAVVSLVKKQVTKKKSRRSK